MESRIRNTVLILTTTLVGLAGCNSAPDGPVQAAGDAIKKVVQVAKPTVIVEQGTRLRVRTADTVTTKSTFEGDTFLGTLTEPVLVAGKEVIASGTSVQGIVVHADEGGRVKGVASLSVRLSKLKMNGKDVPIETSVLVRNAPASKTEDGVKVGVGAGIGAAIGALAGGGKGAAIGAASGGAAGTGLVLATHGKPAVIAAESVLTFRLAAPLTIED